MSDIKIDQNTEIKLNNLTQLIDLNKSKSKFSLQYQVVAEVPSALFSCAVVNQSLMDQSDKINFEIVTGRCSGEVSNRDDKFENYFLALRSDKPLRVRLVVQEVAQKEEPKIAPVPQPVVLQNDEAYVKYVVIGAAVILLVYFMINRKGKSRWGA